MLRLRFITVATFGAPLDITGPEFAVEAFFPADSDTAAVRRGQAER